MPNAAGLRLAAAVTTALLAATMALAVAPAGAAPEGVPDALPVIAEPVARGGLDVSELTRQTPAPKVVDGNVDDWVGTPARLAGHSHFDHGELLHTDFLWDAYGADAGEDIDRWNAFAGLTYQETRTIRVDALLRTLEMQLGVPYPIGADEEYGNLNHGLVLADMYDVRIAADADNVYVLVRTTVMNPTDEHDVDSLGVLLLADTGPGGSAADPDLGLPEDHRFDVLLPVSTGPLGTPPGVDVALNDDGWTNAVEIAVPVDVVAPDGTLDLSIM
ncbi:MAG: hypothetical protein R3249_00950, partial [Nitriliruptorales bacterium]|nr:hypothetical protein [Nitriliruptorales bacterium]